MKTSENIQLLYIDLFCGAGGTSTGVENAMIDGKKIAKVIACVNHDKNAIASHKANHPDAIHYTEDIRTLELGPMVRHINLARHTYPRAKIVLWASLECTNFSRAKGGMSRDADSRTLAEHLFRYVEALDPDIIQIENVDEFQTWGSLIEKRKADILIRHNTKTSLSITISSTKDAGQSFHIGYIPAGAEKLKFHTATTTGIFDNVPHTRHYFKLSKTQGLPELKEYLSLILNELVPGMESLSVDMTLYKLPEICDFEIERANQQQ